MVHRNNQVIKAIGGVTTNLTICHRTSSSGLLVICFNGHIVHNNGNSFITNTPCMTGVVVCRAHVIV